MFIYEPGSQLLDIELAEPTFLMEPYIPSGSIIILYGKPSLGKTPLAWQIAQHIQVGEPLWEFPVNQTNVLFLELDMPRQLVRARWKEADPEFRPQFVTCFEDQSIDCTQFLLDRPNGRYRELLSIFNYLYNKYNFGLICVDALREVVVGDLSPSGEPRKIYDAFHKVFPGSSVLFVHHERKEPYNMFGSGDQLQMAAGSAEFMNIAQVGLHMHKIGKDVYITHAKTQASAQFEPLPISLCEDGVHFINKHEERNKLARQVIQNAAPDIPMRELDKAIGQALNLSERTARIIRTGMKQKGLT